MYRTFRRRMPEGLRVPPLDAAGAAGELGPKRRDGMICVWLKSKILLFTLHGSGAQRFTA